MRQVDNSYQNIRAQAGAYYEYRVVLGGNRYGMSQLRSINFDSALFEGNGPQIGNTYSAQCTVQLFEESANWPRMAQFDVEARLCSEYGNQQTSWFPLGRFYTDTRYDDTFGSLTIQAFDGMLKLEKSWTDKIPSEQLPASWPITSRAFASMIQTANLAQFEDLTQLDNTVPLVGLDTSTTIRDVLKTIAAANGGNWIMATVAVNGVTTEKLRLVKFRNPPEITVEATTADYVYLGRAMKSLDRSPALVGISAVHLETMGGTVVYAGDDTGYQLNGNCEFSDTNGVAELCLDNVSGYVYKPFTASNAYLDLITEPGDIVVADGNAYQVMRLSWQLGKTPVATIAADYDQEIDHEYTITSAQAKQYRKVMAATDEKLGDLQDEFSTAIQQTEQQISLVAQSKVSQTEFEAAVESLQDQIDGNIQSWSGNEVPTLNNTPASDWTTPTQKAEHVGDLYFVNTDAGIPEAGQYYRFEKNGDVYSWQLLDDSALSEALNRAAAALAAAEDAQDTADSASATAALKGRIFVNQPTPPYSVGDLWFDSAQSEIMTCMTARASGNFTASDWVKRNKYTDDSAFQAFQTQYNETITAVQSQLDQKAETYYQEGDPAATWGAAIAGIAVAGVTVIGITGGAGHGGDLWYRTSDNTTWFYDESKNAWVQQDVPDEVFDKIDGKAQIFIAQPYPPYNVGDLWFDSNKSEIMTCVTARPSGSFVASDWEKRNKYTDDTAADEAKQQLVQFKSEFTVLPSQIKAEIEKRVIKDKSETKNSFGWVLSDTSHTWYANGNEVMKASQSGLEVKGKITATSGYIGNGNSGFTIGATSLYNGMTAFSDTTHNGVYVGTDGIALGKGAFKVDNSGGVLARIGQIGGWTLSATSLSHDVGLYHVLMQAPSSPTDNGVAFRVQAANDAGTATESKFYVTYGGKMFSKDADVSGKITATSGVIGGCSISNGKLIVPAANITGTLSVGRLPTGEQLIRSKTETQYYLSTSSSSLSGGSWSTTIPTWASGKYIWTRAKTTNTYKRIVNGEEKDVDDVSYSTAQYDKNLTEARSTSASASSSASGANKRTQIIYRSTSGGSAPSGTTAWVTDSTGGQNKWTVVRPQYSSSYPALYTAQQSETVGGTITCTTPRLDATTTVIDGAHIITGTIDATKLAVSELDALGATIGGFRIEATRSGSTVTGGHIYSGKRSLSSSDAGVYIGTDGIALGGNVSRNSAVSNGTIYYEEGGGTGGGTGSQYYPPSSVGFKVTASGEVTASSIQIQGGSININNNFRVDSSGNLYATSGTFSGNVYAKNILSDYSGGTYGTFSGAGLSDYSVGYAKTGFTGTLDQVDVNKSNIEAMNGYFTGSANFAWLRANNMTLGGYRVYTGTSVNIDGRSYALCVWGEDSYY